MWTESLAMASHSKFVTSKRKAREDLRQSGTGVKMADNLNVSLAMFGPDAWVRHLDDIVQFNVLHVQSFYPRSVDEKRQAPPPPQRTGAQRKENNQFFSSGKTKGDAHITRLIFH